MSENTHLPPSFEILLKFVREREIIDKKVNNEGAKQDEKPS
jgi:hypothetical protein